MVVARPARSFCVKRGRLGCVDGPLKPREEGVCLGDRVVERRSAGVAVGVFGEERGDVRCRRLPQSEGCGGDRLIGYADVGTDLVGEVVAVFGDQAACYVGERLAAVQAVVAVVGIDIDEVRAVGFAGCDEALPRFLWRCGQPCGAEKFVPKLLVVAAQFGALLQELVVVGGVEAS